MKNGGARQGAGKSKRYCIDGANGCVGIVAEDEMIKKAYFGKAGEFDESFGKAQVGSTWRPVARRMVMRDHNSACAPFERFLENFTGKGRGRGGCTASNAQRFACTSSYEATSLLRRTLKDAENHRQDFVRSAKKRGAEGREEETFDVAGAAIKTRLNQKQGR